MMARHTYTDKRICVNETSDEFFAQSAFGVRCVPASLSETRTSRGQIGPPDFLQPPPDDVTPGAQPIGQRGANRKKGLLITNRRTPDGTSRPDRVACAALPQKEGNSEFKKGEYLMKTTMKSRRRSRALLLSILCAGLVAAFLGGCAEGPYVTAYDTGYTYPAAYYTPEYYYGYPDYSYYYGPAYGGTTVRVGPGYSTYYYGY